MKKSIRVVALPSTKAKGTSYNAIRNVKTLGKRQANGNENRRNAQALTLKALRVRADGSQIGFETVLDGILSYGVCPICGKGKCIAKRYASKIPQKTINVLIDEGFDCESIVRCYKANRKEFLAKYARFILELKTDLYNFNVDLERYLNLRAGYIVETQSRFLPQSERFIKKGKKVAKVFSSSRERFDASSLRKSYDRTIKTLRDSIRETEGKLAKYDYVCPEILTKDERNSIRKAIESETNAKRRRKMTFNLMRTVYFIANF